MNQVILIGRLTRDPEVRYTGDGLAIARFSVAIDRNVRSGEEKKADYPQIIAFGKTAEICERYLEKGSLVGISGKIQTGSYEKEGKKVYTTEVVAERVEFLSRAEKTERKEPSIPDGFVALDEDIPF